MDREPQEDSNGVIESFWDGHGVEFKAKYVFDRENQFLRSMARSRRGVFVESKTRF